MIKDRGRVKTDFRQVRLIHNADGFGPPEDKYKSWEWTYGRSPDFAVRHHIRYGVDQVECELQVKRGMIKQITVPDGTPHDSAINDLKAKYLNERYNIPRR